MLPHQSIDEKIIRQGVHWFSLPTQSSTSKHWLRTFKTASMTQHGVHCFPLPTQSSTSEHCLKMFIIESMSTQSKESLEASFLLWQYLFWQYLLLYLYSSYIKGLHNWQNKKKGGRGTIDQLTQQIATPMLHYDLSELYRDRITSSLIKSYEGGPLLTNYGSADPIPFWFVLDRSPPPSLLCLTLALKRHPT